jgi:hypothetical protein
MHTQEKASCKAKANKGKRTSRNTNLHHFVITRETAVEAQSSKYKHISAAAKAHATARIISHDTLPQSSKRPLAHLSNPTNTLPERDKEKTVKTITRLAAIKSPRNTRACGAPQSLAATLQALIKALMPTATLYSARKHICDWHAGGP